VNEALREYIQRPRQAKVVELFGKIDFYSSYDYKKQRRSSGAASADNPRLEHGFFDLRDSNASQACDRHHGCGFSSVRGGSQT